VSTEFSKPEKSPFLVVSYYTIGTPYEYEADLLRGSLHAFKYEHSIVARPNTGSWVSNTCTKADVILKAWETSKLPIVWLDADSIVQKPLTLLETHANLRTDFGAHFAAKPTTKKQNAIWSGTLFFNKTEGAEALLKKWAHRCATNTSQWDQEHLKTSLDDLPGTVYVDLPITYVKRVGKDGYPDEEAHVLHTRAASRLRKVIDGGEFIGPR